MRRHICAVARCRRRATHVLANTAEPDLYLCDGHASEVHDGQREIDLVVADAKARVTPRR